MHANYMLPVAENRKVCQPIKNQGGHLCIRNNIKSTHLTSSMSSTVKPALTVTSVKRSPANNGQFLALPTLFTI